MDAQSETARVIPLQTLQCSTGLLEKGKEVTIPRGEAEVWLAMNPPKVKLVPSKPAATPAKSK